MTIRHCQLTSALLLATCFNVTLLAQNTARQQQVNTVTKEERIKNWLKRQDKNADGKIALAEATGLMKSNFTRNDANKDDFLDREELGKLAERMTRSGPGRNRQPRNQQTMTTEQLLKRVPQGVTVIPDIAYRPGHKAQAWRAMAPTRNTRVGFRLWSPVPHPPAF
jgi:hypothetical protein